MKNQKIQTIAMIVLLVLGIIFYLVKSRHVFGGGVDSGYIQLDSSTASNTSTAVGQPTLVLARNYARSMADICSPSSAATTTWLYFQNFASPTAASTTVITRSGYALAGGSCYQIRANNLFITDVWATSTLSGTLITVIEK